MAVIFIAMKGHVDIKAISSYLNILVGLFMIALGLYGIYTAAMGSQSEGSAVDEAQAKGDSAETDNLLSDIDKTDRDELLEFEDSSKEARFVKYNVAIDLEESKLDTNPSSHICCTGIITCSYLDGGGTMPTTPPLFFNIANAIMPISRFERSLDAELSFFHCGNSPRYSRARCLLLWTSLILIASHILEQVVYWEFCQLSE